MKVVGNSIERLREIRYTGDTRFIISVEVTQEEFTKFSQPGTKVILKEVTE